MNKIIIKITLTLMILLFFSCSNNSNDKDHLVFRYNEHKNINSLDPAFAKDNADIWVINQLFNGLVEMDKDLNIIPSIAQEWSISEDGKTYSFNFLCLSRAANWKVSILTPISCDRNPS